MKSDYAYASRRHETFKRKKAALSQIFLLVVSIVAFSYAIGSEVGEVNGVMYTATGKDLFGSRAACSDCKYYQDSFGEWTKINPQGFSEDLSPKQIDDLNNVFKRARNAATQAGNPPVTAGPTASYDPGAVEPGIPIGKSAAIYNVRYTDCLEIHRNPVYCSDYADNWAKGNNVALKNPPASITETAVPTENGIPLTQSECTAISGAFWENGGCFTTEKWTAETCAADPRGFTFEAGECWEVAPSAATATPTEFPFLESIGKGFVYALGFKAGASLLLPLIGATGSQTEAIGNAGALGIFTAKLAEGTIREGASKSWWSASAETASAWGTGIGIGIAAYYFLSEYREEGVVTTTFSCIPWQPPLSGKNCEKCNNGFLPCSEYQCKSLGQSCELVNKGTSEESCVWVNKNDVSAPTIEALESALLNEDYGYNPNDAILPPDRGVNVNYKPASDSTPADNCVPAFTPLRIGVKLNEPAKCKIDTLRKDDFKTMAIEMSSGLLQYNHTFSLSLPGSANAEAEGIDIANDGNYDLFVRCEDANGNANIGTFVFKYCVDKGPDTTPPLIVATSVPNNMPIAYNQTALDLQVYINEPAECKWSHNNRDYATMEEQMDCQTTIGNTNAQGLYTCNANLTGLKDRFTNTFYFRCKDKSSTPNENAESFMYNVVGTQALVITSATPNDTTIKDSTSVVKVSFEAKTTAGYKDGESACYYSDTGINDDYVKFFTTDSSAHKQDLFLPEGTYDYFIKCIDLGGNTDNKKINFTVESDSEAPIVVRAYHEEQYLKIQTTEEAKCVYDVVDCTYDVKDGTPMTSIDGTSHFTNWDIKSNLYVKCEDTYGNQPLPNACSIIVKSTTF